MHYGLKEGPGPLVALALPHLGGPHTKPTLVIWLSCLLRGVGRPEAPCLVPHQGGAALPGGEKPFLYTICSGVGTTCQGHQRS